MKARWFWGVMSVIMSVIGIVATAVVVVDLMIGLELSKKTHNCDEAACATFVEAKVEALEKENAGLKADVRRLQHLVSIATFPSPTSPECLACHPARQ